MKFLILLIISGVLCAKPYSTRTHTQTYYDWKTGLFDKTFALKDTYGGILENPCTPIGDRSKYIKILNKNNIKCHGDWCYCRFIKFD
jgi:hypothetical protein